jgi:hypothetical protein
MKLVSNTVRELSLESAIVRNLLATVVVSWVLAFAIDPATTIMITNIWALALLGGFSSLGAASVIAPALFGVAIIATIGVGYHLARESWGRNFEVANWLTATLFFSAWAVIAVQTIASSEWRVDIPAIVTVGTVISVIAAVAGWILLMALMAIGRMIRTIGGERIERICPVS